MFRLREQKQTQPDNIPLAGELRTKLNHLRMLEREAGVEKVIRTNSMKAFTERCRLAVFNTATGGM